MSGERALVTGATSGIGEAVARRLAARGAFVGLLGRNASAANRIGAEVTVAGGKAMALIADVADAVQVEAAVARFVAEAGGIDTVVASAGTAAEGTVVETSIEEWMRVVNANLSGMFYTAKYTLPHLLDGGGTFTAIGSDASVQGGTSFAAYAASKHGVVGLIRCLALDHGPHGVRANVVCPAFVETPMIADLPADARTFYQGVAPMGRFARAEEVASAVAYLSSAEASYVNGTVHLLDGGSTAGYFHAR